MVRPRRWIALVAGVALCAVVAAQVADRFDLRHLEERWNRKSSDERALLRERYEQLTRMKPEAREQLAARARRLRGVVEELREDPPEELREELEVLDSKDRERRWRQTAQERFRERGRDMRHKLPAAFVAKLEAAAPEDRVAMMHRFRAERLRKSGQAMFEYLARELDLSDEEIKGFEKLPTEQKLNELRRMRRKHIEKTIETGEAPPGFSPKRWERMRSLSDRELFERLRHGDLPRLGPRGKGHKRGERGHRGPRPPHGPGGAKRPDRDSPRDSTEADDGSWRERRARRGNDAEG